MVIKLYNTYSQLPENFYQKTLPESVPHPKLIIFNEELGKKIGIDKNDYGENELSEYLSGNKLFQGSIPIAQVYAGHQFGYFSPQLGDGRALLLGEITDIYGEKTDIVLKGSGQTNFSRSGDGKATLGSMIREYIMSEALYGLGIKTTRSLGVVSTGEKVFRQDIHPGGIVSRVCSSHIRVGTFEYFYQIGDIKSLKLLADYTVEKLFHKIPNTSDKYEKLLKNVIESQIDLVVDWMRVGFIHGVMNTDNVLISGDTIDYGPCAFMNTYNKNTVFSSIDIGGRYSFGNQRYAIEWNCARFGETLIPLISENKEESIERVQDILSSFQNKFDEKYYIMMHNKLGIYNKKYYDNNKIDELLLLLEKYDKDYTLFFYNFTEYVKINNTENIYQLYKESDLQKWITYWYKKINLQEDNFQDIFIQMKKYNPYIIPRNYKVEEAIEKAEKENNFSYLEIIVNILKNPYDVSTENMKYMEPEERENKYYQTFCGT